MISRRNFVKTSLLGTAAAVASRAQIFGDNVPQQAQSGNLRFGVNYVPSKRWWYCWQDWDRRSIAEDLNAVAGLGVDHVRIQCLWPIFQPGINSVSDRMLDNLHSLLDAADTAGLDVEITVLNGWMSGFSFMSAWVAPLAKPGDPKIGNMFTSPPIVEAEKLLFRKIVEAIGGHRRFLGFDIGNELGCLQGQNSNLASQAEADAWVTDILQYCDEIAPGKFHVNGVDHSHWFAEWGFSRPNIATTGHASVVHSYIYFTGALDHYKYSDPGCLHVADYMVELAYAYQTELLRRVWVEEIGASAEWMPDSYRPEFTEIVVRNIAATGKAWGITWWCSHDLDPAIKGFDGVEYGLGLLDNHNRPTPVGRIFAEIASKLRGSTPEVIPRQTAMVIPDKGLSKILSPADWTYAKPYMRLIERGVTAAILLESRAQDHVYLRQRGISELIPFDRVG